MQGIPPLKTDIDLSPGFNALMVSGQNKKQQETRDLQNALYRKQLDQLDQGPDQIEQLKKTAQAYKAAIDTGNSELARNLIKKFTNQDVNLDFMDNNEISIETPSFSYTGPSAVIQKYNDGMISNPNWFVDHNNVGNAMKWLAGQKGVKSLKIKDQQTQEWKPLTRDEKLDFEREKAKITAKNKDNSAQDNTQKQRLRSQVAKLWGYNEFAKLDEATSKKIEQSTSKAQKYFDEGMPMDDAIAKANDEIRLKYGAKEMLPKANKGVFNNKKETGNRIKGLISLGTSEQDIFDALKENGWEEAEASELIKAATGQNEPTNKSAAPAQYQEGQTATGPNGQKIVFKGGQWVPLQQ